jgi:hypothetical protein
MKTKNFLFAVCVLLTVNCFAQINNNLIITKKGDSIRCTIDNKSTNNVLYYHYERKGRDPKGQISTADIISVGIAPFGYKNKGYYRNMNQGKGNGAIYIVAGAFVALVAIVVAISHSTYFDGAFSI